jgi:hypothetical protein
MLQQTNIQGETTKLEGMIVRRKATGELFTITGKDECGFFLLNGGADNGGRDVLGSELHYYERVWDTEPSACACNGTGWLETDGNHWTKALFQDVRQAFAYRALNNSYKPCGCGNTPSDDRLEPVLLMAA